MSAKQVVFQYLSAGSNTLTVPPGFSNQVLVYAWGAGGGAGYAGGGGGDEYQRTVSRTDSAYSGGLAGGFGALRIIPLRTETITVSPGVIPPPGVNPGTLLPSTTVYGDWIKTSSASPDSRAFGGGGGFVQGILTVSSGDTVVISVGGKGGVGPRDGSGIGGIGDTPAISFNGGTTGVAAPYPGNDDQFYGAGGGGGAATSVLVNGVPMIVAAGGGGGGGGTSYQTGSAGTAGGVATLTSTTPRGGTSPGGYSVGGAGGAGYPLGGAGGETFGDDAGAATGGYGGQNYANASVTSSTLTAGSGITPGGATNALYPKAKRGYAGYDGAVIVIFTKSFQGYVKDTNWKLITNAWVKVPPSTRTVTRVIPPTTDTYNSTGTQTFTIPAGITTVDLTVVGGGGGGGGNDSSPGAAGRAGARIAGTLAVSPGQVLTIAVGTGGGGGASDQGSAAGGRAGINTLGYGGGLGGASGPTPISGAGGGGGAASVILLNGFVAVVAAGGGGGGGGGNGVPGQGVSPGGNSGSTAGGAGTNKSGDGGGGGAGGGGYPSGGAGGSVNGGDTGGNSGADGQNLVPGGFELSQGAAGGVGASRGGRAAGNGGSGIITVSYSTPPITEVVATGGWKPITQAWIKADNEWKSIQSDLSLVPIPSTAEVVTINLNIAANANNYVLSDFLSATSYYPGRSIVNLTVDAGVIVGSGTVGTPALIIDGLVSGDLLNLTNNGNIAGAGGQGGASGSYVVTSSPVYDSKGRQVFSDSKGRIAATTSTVTSIPGRPGEAGGPAIYVTYATNLVNNGTIAGGGGGGGGGGGSTGGQGGGGAGRKVGSGANNGTLTAGGAGTGLGGAGGARGTAGLAGTNGTNTGGAGGAAGAAILGIDKVAIITSGTILGEQKVIAREVG